MPGVSRNAIWPRGSLRMPTMRLRVVCGLVETMETFWPRIRFSRVDLPAFGRPTRATTPKCGFPGFTGSEVSGSRGLAVGALRDLFSRRDLATPRLRDFFFT